MIELYGFVGCIPCEEAERWMNKHDITYTKKGMDDTISEYPTFIIDGIKFIGFGETVKDAILESVNDG